MPYQSVGELPVDVMMNQFNWLDWYDDDDSDVHESIDLIKDPLMQEFDAKSE